LSVSDVASLKVTSKSPVSRLPNDSIGTVEEQSKSQQWINYHFQPEIEKKLYCQYELKKRFE
jgi:hypothetical protein